MTSVRFSKIAALLLAVLLMFALFSVTAFASETEAAGETDSAAATGDETEAPEATESDAAAGDTVTTGETVTTGDTKETKDKTVNWDLIITLAVIGVALIVFFIFYFAKASFREKVKKFFRDYKSELKKIVWSPARDVKKNTIVVIVIALAFALVIGLLDILFSKGIGSLTDLILSN